MFALCQELTKFLVVASLEHGQAWIGVVADSHLPRQPSKFCCSSAVCVALPESIDSNSHSDAAGDGWLVHERSSWTDTTFQSPRCCTRFEGRHSVEKNFYSIKHWFLGWLNRLWWRCGSVIGSVPWVRKVAGSSRLVWTLGKSFTSSCIYNMMWRPAWLPCG